MLSRILKPETLKPKIFTDSNFFVFESREYYKQNYLAASANISNCEATVILCPGHYLLTRNITISNSSIAIVVASSNVVLDLNNFNIFGKNTDVAIGILPEVTRVVIRNGSLIKFNLYGIYSEGKNEFITVDSVIVDRCNLAPKFTLSGGIVFYPKEGSSNDITIRNCKVVRIKKSNNGRASSVWFGALENLLYNCLIENCTISFCDVEYGPLVIYDCELTIRGLTISNCTNVKECIFNLISRKELLGMQLNIDGCLIENNTGITTGILNINGSLLFKNLVYSGNSHLNKIEDGVDYPGRCIQFNNQYVTEMIVENAVIMNNSSDRTLFCIWAFPTNTSVRNVQINNNSAPEEVQGILFSDYMSGVENQVCQFTAENVSVQNNDSIKVSAVAAKMFSEDKKSVFNLSISDCKSLLNKGTGFAYDLSECTNSLLTNCLSQAEYGGVKTGDGKVTVSDCQFIYNMEPIVKGPNTTEYKNLVVQ